MTDMDTERNVEVKAKIHNFDKIIAEVQTMCSSHGELIIQEDTFFNVPNGRLKLRKRSDYSVSELIYYERPDTEGPKLSVFSRCNIRNGAELSNVLKMSLGIKGVVKKTRHLFLIEHTRIHLDEVEGLGKFAEIEVCLNKDQSIEEGEKIVDYIMEKLGISKEDLVTGAYLDLLKKQTN